MFLKFYCHKIYSFSQYQLSKFTLYAINLANVNVRFGTFLQILIEKCKNTVNYQIKCRTYLMQQTVPIFNPLILRSIYTCNLKIGLCNKFSRNFPTSSNWNYAVYDRLCKHLFIRSFAIMNGYCWKLSRHQWL